MNNSIMKKQDSVFKFLWHVCNYIYISLIDTLLCFLRVIGIRYFSSDRYNSKSILSLFDLTTLRLGYAQTIGYYVLIGILIQTINGSDALLSLIIAAFTSAIATICYAEFSCQVPYGTSMRDHYEYRIGEISKPILFLIGCNIILEFSIGTAIIARSLTMYLDVLLDYGLKNSTIYNMIYPLSYFNIFLFLVVILIADIAFMGIVKSNVINNITIFINLIIIGVMICTYTLNANSTNGTILVTSLFKKCMNNNQFFPMCLNSMMTGVTKCYFGFIGLTGASAISKKISNCETITPFVIILPIMLLLGVYLTIASVLLMTGQSFSVSENSVMLLTYMFESSHTKIAFTLAIVFALSITLLGGQFTFARVINGTVIKECLFRDQILTKSNTSVVITPIIIGLFTAFLTTIFCIDELLNILTMVTLFTYKMVILCIVIVRYKPNSADLRSYYIFEPPDFGIGMFAFLKIILNIYPIKRACRKTSIIVYVHLFIFYISSITLCTLIIYWRQEFNRSYVICGTLGFLIVLMFEMLIILHRQPQSSTHIPYKVPLMPLLPCLGLLISIYLILVLNWKIWFYVLTWQLACVFFYYINESVRNNSELQVVPTITNKYLDVEINFLTLDSSVL